MLGEFRSGDTVLRSFFESRIKESFFFCLILVYVLFLLDIATTTVILSLGGHEINMVMAPFVGNYYLHLFLKGLVLVLAGTAGIWAEGKIPGSGLTMLLVIIGWYSIVIFHNTSVLIELCAFPCP